MTQFRAIWRVVPVSHAEISAQVASLQGYLLKNKTRPRECVEEVSEWCGVHLQSNSTWELKLPLHRIQQEREARARLKREKEEVRLVRRPF